MRYTTLILFVIIAVNFAGCSAKPSQTPDADVVIKHSDEIDVLRGYIAKISENSTFPSIVEPLRKSMHNPERFQFIRAEAALRERSIKLPSGKHINYYYLIRIHFRGENAFGALRLSHQDYRLYPSGKIQPIQKK